MDGLAQILITSVFSLGASVVTAWLTVKFSLQQFRSTRWWEKKHETYSHIMEQLSLLEWSLLGIVADLMNDRTPRLEKSERDRRADALKHAGESIYKIAAMGAYVISSEAAAVLDHLMEEFAEPWRSDDPTLDSIKFLRTKHAAVKIAIVKLRQCAKTDLWLK